MKRRKVFVSYAANDAAFAKSLGRVLARKGVEVFDGLTVRTGDDVFETIRDELNSSDLLVFVVPLREGEGRFALQELGAARIANKKIFAVLPSKSRYANSDVARVLSKGLMVNAERLTPAQLADTIIESIPAELSAA